MSFKINWAGRFEKYEGYGYYNTRLLEAVASFTDIQVAPIHTRQMTDWTPTMFKLAGYDMNRPLILIHPPDLPLVTPFPGRVWCLTMYEGTALPEGWVNNLNNYCERLLVPGVFCRELFRNNDVQIPINIVPGGIDSNLRVINQPLDRPYTFMALVDRGNRKGWDLVWRAFYDVFGMSSDVRLILKMRQKSGEIMNGFLKEAGSDPRLSILRSDVDRVEDLFCQADCFVFPSRGEGYGLPPREAAGCGLPTIVTRWSGLDDETDEWALPINKFVYKPSLLPAGGEWVEPDYDELCGHMEWCYSNQEAARAKGLEAANWLKKNRTWKQAAETLHDLMEEYMVN